MRLPEVRSLQGKMTTMRVEYLVGPRTGLTAVVCQPHQPWVMVRLIVVGSDRGFLKSGGGKGAKRTGTILDAPRVRGKEKTRSKALVEEAIASRS